MCCDCQGWCIFPRGTPQGLEQFLVKRGHHQGPLCILGGAASQELECDVHFECRILYRTLLSTHTASPKYKVDVYLLVLNIYPCISLFIIITIAPQLWWWWYSSGVFLIEEQYFDVFVLL